MNLTNESCPEWVKTRVALILNDLQVKDYFYFVHTISFDDVEANNNKFTAFFVTERDVVEVTATLESVIIYKYKKENIDKVIKRIKTSIKDEPTLEEVIYESMELIFKDGRSIFITEPTYKEKRNLLNYRLFISRF